MKHLDARRLLVVAATVGTLLPPLVLASHPGPPGAGGFDPYVDVHGDTITGPLVMGAGLQMGRNPVVFAGGTLQADPDLVFDLNRVCLADVAIDGCSAGGDVSSVLAGPGLVGGGTVGDLVLSVDTGQTQARVTGKCADTAPVDYVTAVNQDGSVVCGTLADGDVTAAKLADASVTGPKLASNAVTTGKIADGTITSVDIAAGGLNNPVTFGDGVIGRRIIAGAAIHPEHISQGGVQGDAVASGAITNPKLAADAVTSAKILDGTIVAADIGTDAVGNDELQAESVDEENLRDNAVTSMKILDRSVSTDDFEDFAVTTPKIANGSVGAGKLADAAVTTAKILDGTIVAADVDDGSVQRRVGTSCAAGSSIRAVNADGTVACEDDTDTTYTATNGITLNGTSFSLLACTNGQILKVGAGGSFQCGTDVDTNAGGTVTSVGSGTGLTGGPITGSGTLSLNINGGAAQTCSGTNKVSSVTSTGIVTCSADVDTNAGGTVTSVGSGTGLTGGPITGSGTLSIATGGVTGSMLQDGTVAAVDLAFDPATQAELDTHKGSADHDARYVTEGDLQTAGTINAAGNPVHWTKLQGVPGGLADGVDADSGGTVTSITAGTGLSGGTITGTGTVALSLNGGATQTCDESQVMVGLNATGIISCALEGGDISAVNVVDGSGLTGGGLSGSVTLGTDSDILQLRVAGSCAAGSAIRVIDAGGFVTCASIPTAWLLAGNGGTLPGTDFLGTTDNQPFELKVNNQRALRVEPSGVSPNWVGGYSGNSASAGTDGGVIAGGGKSGSVNTVSADFGAVGGGFQNTASGQVSAIGGGEGHAASGSWSVIGGGYFNTASANNTFIGGGLSNTASGVVGTIGGGDANTASGQYSTVPGGQSNTASGNYAFAAGRRAKANHAGTFVWADSQNADFASSKADAFLVRAQGGVGIGTTNPVAKLHVSGDTKLDGDLTFGNDTDTIVFAEATGATDPMILMFNACCANANRTVIGHSSGFPNWGLRYVDGSGNDRFVFGQDAADKIASIDMIERRVGIGTETPARALHVVNTPPDGYQVARLTSDGATGSGVHLEARAAGGRAYTIVSTANNAGAGGGKLGFYDETAGAYRMVVDSAGKVGILNTAPSQELDVSGDINLDLNGAATTNGVCHSGADADVNAVDRDLVVCSQAPGDVAEWYETTGASPGEIVATTPDTVAYLSSEVDARTGTLGDGKERLVASVLARSSEAYQTGLLGVVSTSPVQTMGKAILDVAERPAPIAATGRVPTKVSAMNGPIAPGDPITSSPIPGVGMKATGEGPIVGFALDHYTGDGVGTILVYVAPGWHGGAGAAALASENTRLSDRVADLEGRLARMEALVEATLAHAPGGVAPREASR